MHKIRIISIFMTLFFLAAGSAAHVSAQPADTQTYKIGIGDVLSIATWKEPDLSLEAVQVRRDGKITFPLLDDIQAEGISTVDLKKTITAGLADYVESPAVTVTLINAVSQKYYILGEVQEVGEYPLIKKLTVVQAFALAKGFTEWASKSKIILFRQDAGKETVINIDYKDIARGKLGSDIVLQADDIIIVP